ncbi:MAG: hypothetical protein EAZ55_05095 [Cytophagales bacterium]|nr:MAG: hypothetical protein EAZ55_05095 [Cytophagales bacterium]
MNLPIFKWSSLPIHLNIAAIILLAHLSSTTLQAQPQFMVQDVGNRSIQTSAYFLLISPDGRSNALGDVGAATSPDLFSAHHNPAKIAFLDKKWGVAYSHTPWMRDLTREMFFSYLTAYHKIDKLQTIGIDLKYFNAGNLEIADVQGNTVYMLMPREFALSLQYARKLSNTFSVAIAARYIQSNLAPDVFLTNHYDNGNAYAATVDLACYYQKNFEVAGHTWYFNSGMNISNVGTKMKYSQNGKEDFVPANLRLGLALTGQIDFFNKITIALDANKLLVPTPPIVDNQGQIILGVNPNQVTVMNSLVSSFNDAPGGSKEELQEIMIGVGVEYWYNDMFAARLGYCSENPNKGNRRYISLGVGTRYEFISLDVAYLFSQSPNNPLAETMKVSLGIQFNKPLNLKAKNQNNHEEEPTQEETIEEDEELIEGEN